MTHSSPETNAAFSGPDIVWSQIKAVIFDVDGTLYSQAKLRPRMLAALLSYYALRPWRAGEMLVLQRFRAAREKHHGAPGPGLEAQQYNWGNEKAQVPVSKIRQVVEQWIFRHPIRYLAACVYPGTHAFFAALRRQGIKIGIYSDYPAAEKLTAMGLAADIIVSSTDPEIDHLKPAPQGLLHIARTLGLSPGECLFIGDRPELDGVCAAHAGMPHLITSQGSFDTFTFYQLLEKQLLRTSTIAIYE